MNPALSTLQPYPFERLAKLLKDCQPSTALSEIPLTVGEPQHAPPEFVLEVLREKQALFAKYPTTAGIMELREACAGWLQRRFSLHADAASQVLPVNGTREGLFSFTQAIIDRSKDQPLAGMPNPFYQIYEGAALLAGAAPLLIPCDDSGKPEFNGVTAADWDRCQLLFLCSPGNPTGAVLSIEEMSTLIELAERHDFVIASDECYADIYLDTAPPSILNACLARGDSSFKRCIAFHSLSKRSNLPGLRSGFVAGDADILAKFLRYRTYHGCTLPLPTQHASIAAWGDDDHVETNRAAYRDKFASVLPILQPVLDVGMPDAGFYLWPKIDAGRFIDDADFSRQLYAATAVKTLPGSYLSRDTDTGNPGQNRIRMSLVATTEDCHTAATRIRDWLTA